jgi:hypothetical protein
MEIDMSVTAKYRCIDAHTLPTPLLHVSQEARQAALRRYQLSFGGLIKEMTYTIQQLVKAWKERLQTEDDKKLPFLWFASGVHVERYL